MKWQLHFNYLNVNYTIKCKNYRTALLKPTVHSQQNVHICYLRKSDLVRSQIFANSMLIPPLPDAHRNILELETKWLFFLECLILIFFFKNNDKSLQYKTFPFKLLNTSGKLEQVFKSPVSCYKIIVLISD